MPSPSLNFRSWVDLFRVWRQSLCSTRPAYDPNIANHDSDRSKPSASYFSSLTTWTNVQGSTVIYWSRMLYPYTDGDHEVPPLTAMYSFETDSLTIVPGTLRTSRVAVVLSISLFHLSYLLFSPDHLLCPGRMVLQICNVDTVDSCVGKSRIDVPF